MTRKDLLDIIESLLEVVNNLSSKGPDEEEKKKLDQLADALDTAQNSLMKLIVKEHDAEVVRLGKELGAVQARIRKDLTELEKMQNILDGIGQAVALTTEIIKLSGV